MVQMQGLVVAGAEALMALGFGRLAARRRAAALGAARWVAVGSLLLLAALQLDASLGRATGWLPAAAASVLAVSVWRLVGGLEKGLRRTLGKRGRARLEAQRAEMQRLRVWQELAGQAAPLGHWRLARGAQTLEWSEAMYRLHGLTPAAFTPALVAVLAQFHEEDRQAVAAALVVVGAEGGQFELRVRLRRPDSELRHVILRGKALDGALLGVMLDVTPQRQAEARLDDAKAVAEHANQTLREIAGEDGLTGIANRRKFDQALVAEFKRAVRSNLPLGLVLVDVDHLQALNEQLGRAAGDVVLRRVAQAVKAVPRRTGDLVARFSGGQFGILLPLADEAGALCVAAMVREAVRELGMPNQAGTRGRVTVSCGAAAFAGLAEISSPQQLVQRADQALFHAKQEGRDRALRYEPRMQADLPVPFVPGLTPELERFIRNQTS